MTDESSFIPRVPQNNESADDRAEKVFVEFVKRSGYTGEEMREAYYQLLGIAEGGEVSAAVSAICEQMEKMVEARFPLNRFAKLIESKEVFDSTPERVLDLIATLSISDNEKRVLQSLVERPRSGSLTSWSTAHSNGRLQKIHSIEIPIEESRIARAVMVATLLKTTLDQLNGQPFEITFEED